MESIRRHLWEEKIKVKTIYSFITIIAIPFVAQLEEHPTVELSW